MSPRTLTTTERKAVCEMAEGIVELRDSANATIANFHARHGCVSDDNRRELERRFDAASLALMAALAPTAQSGEAAQSGN